MYPLIWHFLTEIVVVPVQNPICIQENNQERQMKQFSEVIPERYETVGSYYLKRDTQKAEEKEGIQAWRKATQYKDHHSTFLHSVGPWKTLAVICQRLCLQRT